MVWRSLSYHRPEVGGRVKGAVCLIAIKRGRARLDFIHGVCLADPPGLLQGRQVSKRYIPIATREDVARPEIPVMIREAVVLDPRAWAKPELASGHGGIVALRSSSSRHYRGR